jgi:phosphoglycolate phosphatase
LGARENGVDCAGVLYGYGSRQELLEAGVAALIESPDQLVRLPAL